MRISRVASLLLIPLLSLFGFRGTGRLAEGASPAPGPAAEVKAERELHVVGIHVGFTKSGGKVHGGKALVSVKRPGKQVILVLAAYNLVTWEVSADPDTRLEKVILCGYHRQTATGLSKDVEVTEAFREDRKGETSLAFYAQFRTLAEALHGKTGLRISSFSGAYRADSAAPVVVDRVQDDPRLSAEWPTPTPLANLPKLTFKAMFLTPGKYGHETKMAYGDFTLSGPKEDALKPAPHGVWRMTYDPDGMKYYGVAEAGNAIVEVDMEKRAISKLDLGLHVPRLNTPTDLTFDTKRNRLLLCATSCLCAYSPASGKWSVLADKFRVVTMAYHPGEDALYALQVEHEGEPTLVKFNPEGAALKKVTLEGPIDPRSLPRGPGITGIQLVHTDGRLVLLAGPGGHHLFSTEEGAPLKKYIYLVDPESGKARLTWKAQ
jgi:hypothetical protein